MSRLHATPNALCQVLNPTTAFKEITKSRSVFKATAAAIPTPQ